MGLFDLISQMNQNAPTTAAAPAQTQAAPISSDPALNAYTHDLTPEQLQQAGSKIFNGYSDGGLNFGTWGGSSNAGHTLSQGEDASTGLAGDGILGGYVGYNKNQINNSQGGYFENSYDPTGKYLKQSYVAPPNGWEKAIDMGTMAVLAAAGGAALGGATGAIGGTEAGVGGGLGESAGAAAFNPAMDSQLANVALGPQAYAGYGIEGAGSLGAGGVFNPAMDSQLANTGIASAGGNPLAGYATGATSIGGVGGVGGSVGGSSSLGSTLANKAMGTGLSSVLGGGGGNSGSGSSSNSSGLNLGGIAGLLTGAYGMNQQQNASNSMLDYLKQRQSLNDNMYASGSPELAALQQEMDRKDAAAGRNSQYGPRSVDLAARVAQLKMNANTQLTSNISKYMADSLNQRANAGANVTSMIPQLLGNGSGSNVMNLSSLISQLGGSGSNYISNLFNNGGFGSGTTYGNEDLGQYL